MDVIIDASCVMSVLLGEDESAEVREKMRGKRLVSAACLPYEVGNSITAAVKRHRVSAEVADEMYREFQKLPVRLIDTDIEKAVRIAAEENHYAYDAYYIACALDKGFPLYTFDDGMLEIAKKRGVKCL